MGTTGEQICGEYLERCRDCQAVIYDLRVTNTQRAIDVVGLDLQTKTIYVCEVATHLGGLQYVTNKQPDNFNRLKAKFDAGIPHVQSSFKNMKIVPMLWSPIVKSSGIKHNAMRDMTKLETHIQTTYGLKIQLIINDQYRDAVLELKALVSKLTTDLRSPVGRMLQILSKIGV